MANREARLILRLIDGVSGPAKGVVSSLASVNGAVRTLSSMALAPARMMTGLGRSLRRNAMDLAAFSAPLTLGLAEAGKAVYAYEKAGNRMEAFGLLTLQQRKTLEGEAQRLNKDFPQTNKEILDAAGELFRAGLTYEQALGALQGSLQLSLAGDIATERAADIATNIMYAMKLPMATFEQVQASLKRVNDLLAYGAAKSNTDIAMMADTFRYVAPLAAVAGMRIEEVTGVTMDLAKAGIKGSEAGVALRSALVRMAKPTKPMLQAFARLNLDMRDFVQYQKHIDASTITSSLLADGYDLSGLSKSIQSILDDKALAAAPQRMLAELSDLVVQEIGDESVRKNITQTLQDAITAGAQKVNFLGLMKALRDKGATITDIAQIFDVRMGSRLAAILYNDLDSVVDDVTKNAAGTSEKISKVMIKGIVGSVLSLSAALENFAIVLSDSGVLGTAIKVIDQLSDSINELGKTNPRILELGTYAAIALAAMAPLGLVLSGLASAMALLVNPLTAVVVGIGYLAAINFDALVSFGKAFSKFFVDNLDPRVIAAFGQTVEKIKGWFKDLATAGESGDAWGRAAKKWGENVAYGVNTAYDAITKAGAAIKDFFDWAGIDVSVLGDIAGYGLALGAASIGISAFAGAITRLAGALFVLSGAKLGVGVLKLLLGVGGGAAAGGAAGGAGAGAGAAAGGGILAGLRVLGWGAAGLLAGAWAIKEYGPGVKVRTPAPNTPGDYFNRFRQSNLDRNKRAAGLESASRTKDDKVELPLDPVLSPTFLRLMNEDFAKAKALASETGTDMESELSVTATPVVNTSSLDAALAKARAVGAAIRSLGTGPAGLPALNYTADDGDSSARTGVGARASGGPVRRGLTYEINECGTETVTMGSNGYVTPAHRVGGGGGPLIGNVHIHGANADEVMAKLGNTLNRALERSRQLSLDGRPVVG